jgi:hypothetical protein
MMATQNRGLTRKLSYRGQVFSLAILFSFVVLGPLTAEAGILFESSWNTATGSSDAAINDGGKWYSASGMAGVLQEPYVSAGGPGGNNFLNMVTVGTGGWGNPYYMSWVITGEDIFGDPDDLYVRAYFRVHSDWVPSPGQNIHWFTAIDNPSNMATESGHYLQFNTPAEEFPALADAPFALDTDGPLGRYQANIAMETERWYRFEIHCHKISSMEMQFTFRLDGVDITNNFLCIAGDVYGQWFGDVQDGGEYLTNPYYGNIWMTIYDSVGPLNNGWDVACVEVRDDTWPGPVGPPVDDTTPPTGSIEIMGVEGRTDRTGTTAVTLMLTATDSGSGMGSGAQMQFSNNGSSWSTPEPYATSKTGSLIDIAPGTEQTQTAYVRFKDVAGNWSNAISDSIILDRQPPNAPSW